jgi:hypothetical protein
MRFFGANLTVSTVLFFVVPRSDQIRIQQFKKGPFQKREILIRTSDLRVIMYYVDSYPPLQLIGPIK